MRTKILITFFLTLALALYLAAPLPASSLQEAAKPSTKSGGRTKTTKKGTAPHQTLTDEQRAARTVEATMNWEKSSSPGVKASTELIKKADVKGHQVFEYRLKVSGAPHNQIYKLMVWPVTMAAPIVMMDGLAIAQDGTVGCPANSTNTCAQRFKGAELKLTYAAAKGEIYRHALISQNKKVRAFFSILPDPLLHTDKACSLEAIRLSPSFELVAIRGKGFQPGDNVIFRTHSFEEVHTADVHPDKNGQFHAQLTPFVKGHTSGKIEVSATGKSCAPHLSFDWGQQP
jgi:hypothetical protein